MKGILSGCVSNAKSELLEHLPWIMNAQVRLRYLIILHLYEGRGPTWIAGALKVDRSTVYRTARRFREEGESDLFDHREQNGQPKLTEESLETLAETVAGDPPDFGWKRPTWTREMLIETLAQRTGMRVALSTMSTALGQIRARRGRSKPTVQCPWPEAEKQQRLDEIRTLVETAPAHEVVVYEDEVDIHLNPMTRCRLDAPRPAKGSLHTRKEREAVFGRRPGRTDERIDLRGRRAKAQVFISAAVGACDAVSDGQKDSRDPGQLCDPYESARAGFVANAPRAADRTPLPPSLLPGPQQNRAHLAGPARQRHPESSMFRNARAHQQRPRFHP